ncbi:MAG: hypothetical protein PF693_07530 [Spirochaetia bacterium]|nr:hypothetical protein [Spirochaetia bacterium]
MGQALNRGGIYELEVTIERDGQQINSYKIEYLYEIDSNQLEIDQSEDIVYTADDFYLLTGKVSGRGKSLYINDQKVSLNGRKFEHMTALNDGLNVIRIELKNFPWKHTIALKFLYVYKYADNLIINIDRPSDGSYVSSNPVIVSGTIQNAVDLESVTVNGVAAKLDGSSFAVSINIESEIATILINATDNIVGTKSKSITIYQDLTPPQVSDVFPPDNYWIASHVIPVTGYVTDQTRAQVYVNGYLATQIDGYFRSVTSLVEGGNLVHIVARDLAGNETYLAPLNINADTTAPDNLVVQSNVSGWTNDNRPVLTFSAEDPGIGISHYEVSIDGRSFQEQSSPFQTPIIEDGVRAIIVKAVDKLGNYSEKSINVSIDTLPPDSPSTFRAIPGNENVVLSWNEDDDETVSYKITSLNGSEEVTIEVNRDSGLLDEETNISSFELDYDKESAFNEVLLENGEVYQFSMVAVDRAGNESISKEVEVTIGVSIVEYDDEEGSFIEFDSVKLMIGPDSLPEEIEQIIIYETMSEDLEDLSTYPIVSPIYSFNAITADGEIIDHVDFDEDFYAKLDYNEEDLPEGFPEQNLGVYFFDTTWSRWFKEPNSIVDTENNQIIFSTNHFTEFTIQPTVIEDLSPQELAAIEFEPFSSTTQHQQLTVSQQSGGISTSMTEFVLPGKNGFDFELRRIYDTGTAKGDANGLSANISVLLGDILNGTIGKDLAISFGSIPSSQILNSVKSYFQNNGDYAYSTGQGWRLNLPYIRGANSTVLVRTSSGAFHNIKSMDVDFERTKEYGIYYREVWFDNHEGEDFTLMVKQTKDPIHLATSLQGYLQQTLDSWALVEAVLYEKDGKEYHFDALGRLTSIKDPNGNNISLIYDGLLLDYIEDTLERRVRFHYSDITDVFSVPQIDRIWVENDPQDREVKYEYMNSDSFGLNIPLPLLSKAIDVGKREYKYDYDPNFLFSGEFGIKINVVALIADLFTGGAFSAIASEFGLSSVTIHAAAQAFWTFPMSFAEGYGIGKNIIDYDIKTLDYWEADTADYLFGFIPTALDVSIGMQQRFLTNNLIRTNLFLGESVTENYSYNFKYAGEKQFYCASSTKDDGRLKEEYLYDTKRKIRWSWAVMSDYIGDIIGGAGVTSRPFNFEYIPLEKTKNSYDSNTGEFLEYVQTEWYSSNLQPSLKQVSRSGGNYFRNSYQYDNWGNVTRQTISDVNGTRTSSKTIYSVFADTNSSLISSIPWQTSPFSTTNINSDFRIHDRLTQRLVKMEDSISELRYIDTAYNYDTKGNRTASALYNDEYGWQQTDYVVNSAGEVTKKTSPKGHVTDITYDYDSTPGYYTISQVQNGVTQGDGSTQNIDQSTIYYRYTGLPAWSIDGRGMLTYFEYDEVGRKTHVELPDDDDSPVWAPISEPNPGFRENNPETAIAYDDINQTITVANAGGAETKYSYHDYGKITEKIQTNRYGSSGIPESGITFNSEEDIRTVFNYDIYNNITSVEDPNGNITDYEYDALGNLTKEMLPAVDGSRAERTYSYNYYSREKRITNENGYQAIEYSDAKGNVLRRVDLDKNGSFDRSADFFFDDDGNLVREIDGNYNIKNYIYNERNQMVETVLPSALLYDGVSEYIASPRVVTAYNKDGFKIKETSYKNGNESVVEFDVNGIGQTIETTAYFFDLEGNNKQSVTRSIFDKSGNEVVVIDPRNYQIDRTFSARGKVLTETDPLGKTVSYEYDNLDRQVSMTDQRGNSGNYPDGDFEIEYIYDDLDRMITGLLPKHSSLSDKPEVKLVYDPKGNLLYRIEADGGLTSYEFDSRNRVISETRTSADSTSSYTTLTDYDGVGNVTILTQAGASPVEFEYDALNRKTLDIYPDGGTRYYRYDENDNLVYEDGANGYRTYYNYNTLNMLIKKTDPEDGVSEYMYDEAGSLTLHKDENGVERKSVYDELNRLLKETDGRDGVSTFSYDLSGNLAQKTDPNGTDVTYNYGLTNLMDSAYYLNGVESHTVSYNYDEGGAVKNVDDGSVANSYNIITGTYVPDPYGLIFSDVQTADGETRTVSYDYDIKNRLTNMIAPSGESVTYGHNGLDQIISMPGFIAGDIAYADNSYLSGYTLANNVQLNREYDDKLRLTKLDYTNGIEELKKFTFSYDREDNIIQKNNDYFSYDGKNQLKSASLAGEEAAQEYPYEGEGKIMDIHPDVLGEETMVLSEDDLTLDWEAKSLGIDLGFGYRVKRIILKPTSTTTRVTEDTLQIFASLYNLEDYYTEPVAFTYEKDEVTGVITILFDNLQFARFIKIHSHFYEMDETGESLYNESTMTLTETDPFDVFILSSGRNEFYTYDPKGNRERLSYFTTSFTSYNYSYYPGSDLIKTDGKYGYKYDANGNMTEKGSVFTETGDEITITKEDEYFRYEYDLLNRLKNVYSLDELTEEEVLVKSYAYNASGMRILAEDAEGIKTYYTFDLDGKVVEKETDGTIRNFFYLGSKVIAHKETGETLYYGTDHLGSSVLMTDATGATVWTGAVTPFADQENTEGLSEHVMFSGKELDTDTGLYYYNARWYDPGLGRFITVDPARAGLNWYSYVSNNPINMVDPTGLAEIYADDIHGNPILAYQGRDLKADTSLEIKRDSDNEFYNDKLSVKIGNQTFQQFSVQSEADIEDPDLTTKYNGRTLEAGTYESKLLENSYSYEKPIQLVDDFYIHPDRFTTDQKIFERLEEGKGIGPFSQPYSAGCQICVLDDFNTLTSTLEGIGFQYNDKDTIDVTIIDDKKGK